MKKNFIKKIENRELKIGVIGLGYVGLPLAVNFMKAGFNVVGIDDNKNKLKKLKSGDSYVQDVNSKDVDRFIENGQFQLSDNYESIKNTDAVSIAVPTPLSKSKNPDLTFVIKAINGIMKNLNHSPYLIVLESTTYPGTTREFIVDSLEKKGFNVGEDVFVCFSPERVDPGNATFQTKNTPKIIGGYSENCLEVGVSLYETAIENIVKVKSLEEAEMAKLLENTFRAVNIALVNEMALMCDRMGIDIWNVIDAASTKPFGYMPFYPGPGIGGHCIPLDPQYLSWKAKTYGFFNRFIELASDINANMPRFVVNKILLILNENKKALKDSRILIMGMSYKKDINDLRESPAFDIIEALNQLGAQVDFCDPYFQFVEFAGKKVEPVVLKTNDYNKYDLTVLITNHSCFNLNEMVENSKLVFDTRNALKDFDNKNIVRL